MPVILQLFLNVSLCIGNLLAAAKEPSLASIIHKLLRSYDSALSIRHKLVMLQSPTFRLSDF